MEYRTLGQSGIRVSSISFGAGPISGLMVGNDHESQYDTVQQALESGINWFDTAATYGNGQSETALGSALQTESSREYHIATKVRLMPEQLDNIPQAVRESFEASLKRLGASRVTLLQLHNSVTSERGDLPTSLTVRDVLGKEGVVTAFESLKAEGRVDAFGFTGLGEHRAVVDLVRSRVFTSAQVPLSLLTPVAGEDRSAGSIDVNYPQLVDECQANDVGVIAIRVFAGGALSGQDPSPYTYRTKFFSLDLFRRDQQRVAQMLDSLPNGMSPAEATMRYVTSHSGVTTALIGFASPTQIEQACSYAERGPLEH